MNIHRVAADIGATGKDTLCFMSNLVRQKVPAAFAMKDKVDGYLENRSAWAFR